MAGTLSFQGVEGLRPWGCDRGLSFYPRCRDPWGLRSCWISQSPFAFRDLPCPQPAAVNTSGLDCAGGLCLGQQGDWLARGRCWAVSPHSPSAGTTGAPPAPVPAAHPPRLEPPSSQASSRVACTLALEAPAPLIPPAQRGGPFLWSLISGQTLGPWLASRLFYPMYSHPSVTAPLRALECSLHSDGSPSDTHPFLKWD